MKLPRPRRVPIILQMTTVECGAACLAMILSFWGRATRVAELRDAWGIGRDGVTAHLLATEARRLGLRAAAVAISAAQFGRIPLPAIVHWQFDHFVVVERWSPKRVVVVDPAGKVPETPLVSGWLRGDRAWGRPVDVELLPDGSLLVSDDRAGAIYRVRFAG